MKEKGGEVKEEEERENGLGGRRVREKMES
jgi:hypothetical protein